jgi:hypothetical protein
LHLEQAARLVELAASEAARATAQAAAAAAAAAAAEAAAQPKLTNSVPRDSAIAYLVPAQVPASSTGGDAAMPLEEEAEAARARSGATDAHAAALEEFCMGIMNTTEFIYTN